MNKFIDWNSLDFRKDSGREKLRCPECDEVRTDKKDKALVIYHNDGVGKCFYCEALTFRDSLQDQPEHEKKYELPKQDWRNYTQISDNLVKWVEQERKIAQSTLIDLGVTEEKYYQPKHKKEVNNIVFNNFEGDTVVNKKYRSGSKSFTQSAGAKNIFYNINSVIGQKEVYIVEGEFDVLALHDHGIKNVISVPNGANDNDDYWQNSEPYLKEVEKLTYEHTVKADAIPSALPYENLEKKVFAKLYNIEGNVASNIQFVVTDSAKHVLAGSLYFYVKPNYDSILPAAHYLQKDIQHIMETVKWK